MPIFDRKKSLNPNTLKVVSACSNPWGEMRGSKQSRFCSDCQKNVHNVAAMTKREVLKVYKEADGHCCMRITRRKDGSIVFNERSLSARLAASAHAPLFAFLSGLSLLAAARPASAQSAPSTDVPPGYTTMTIDAPDAVNIPPNTSVDVNWRWRDGEKIRVETIVRNVRLLAHPSGPTKVSLLVSESDAKKMAEAQKSENSLFVLSPVAIQEPVTGDVTIDVGLIEPADPRNPTGEESKSCMTRMDDKLKRLVKFCLEGGKWIRVE